MNTHNEMTPAASWATVAREVIKHPLSSGLVDIAIGGLFGEAGYTMQDTTTIAAGMVIAGVGVDEVRSYAMQTRYPPAPH